jgi:hypothetical protein
MADISAPCLGIEENHTVQWLDAARQIIQYVYQRFDAPVAESLPRLIKGLKT